MKKQNQSDYKNLYKAILSLKTEEECSAFFSDVCTIQELEALSQRLNVAIMLKDGVSYLDVNKQTGASTATISRVGKCLNYGEGGYETVIKRIK
ncbi:MAG: TrpR YerC/YecD [Clostridia bacterium]|nr:TrpR YerC/YecD [Clostridia bacterium]